MNIGHNGIDPEKLTMYVESCEAISTEIASAKGSHAKWCQERKAEQKEIIDAAKDDAGIPKKEFRAILKRREMRQKLDAIRENMEAEQQDMLDQMEHALGDLSETPLGEAAMQQAKEGQQTLEGLTGEVSEGLKYEPADYETGHVAPETGHKTEPTT